MTRLCPMRIDDECLYRSGQPGVSRGDIAGQLRTSESFVSTYQWNLAKGATDAVEYEVKIAMMPQVQVVRLNRFPFQQERRRTGTRIRLPWRSAWNLEKWTAFQAAAALDTAPDWLQECLTDITAHGFALDEAPIQVTYGSCCGDTTTMDAADYRLTNSRKGDYLCRADGCCSWPYLSCCCDGCDGVTIKYVVGWWDTCQIIKDQPLLHHNVMALFGWLHENPAGINEQNTQQGWNRVLRPMLNRLRWTL